MARPERNNVDYFPFYCEDGKKMFYLEETYGNDGFATFVKILRELAKTDYHYLDLSKTTTMMFLSAKCKISKELLESIIKDLVDLEKFDRVLWEENKIIWCQDFINSIDDAYRKRNNECITYEGLLNLLTGLGIRKQGKVTSKGDIKPQIKENKIKEDNNKQINNIYILEYSFDDFWEIYPNKTNKKKAKEKFNKLSLVDKELIEQHLPFFINNPPFKEYKYPHAITYLNQERYKDEIQISDINLKTINNERFNNFTDAIREKYPDA